MVLLLRPYFDEMNDMIMAPAIVILLMEEILHQPSFGLWFSHDLQGKFECLIKKQYGQDEFTVFWKSLHMVWSWTTTIKPIWAPAKTSDILEQLHQDIDTWYHHETLRNDRGDTKNDDSWYTCSPDFIAIITSSGTMRDTQKTMTISATSFRGCNRFSPLLICPRKLVNGGKWLITPSISH